MSTIIGIDPGGRNVGVVAIDTSTQKIVYSGTFRRPDDMLPVTWATYVTERIDKEIVSLYDNPIIGIENVEPPKSHFQGKKALMNPKHIIWLAIVVGSLANKYPNAVMVRPGKNGLGSSYPDELEGRRPKDLPGVREGPRNHERSAYDVAQQIERLKRENYVLDQQKSIFDI